MTLFIENKYTRWYFNIVSSRPARTRGCDYFELHHIIPQSIGGVNQKDNLVLLTAKEHFLVHWLLTKMCINPDHKRKMMFALSVFRQNAPGQQRFFTAGQYDILRKTHYESIKGENHPSYGKPKSADTKAKMSKAALGRKASEETKAKFRETHKGAGNSRAKTWIITDPFGVSHEIRGSFQPFCDENKILAPTLR